MYLNKIKKVKDILKIENINSVLKNNLAKSYKLQICEIFF